MSKIETVIENENIFKNWQHGKKIVNFWICRKGKRNSFLVSEPPLEEKPSQELLRHPGKLECFLQKKIFIHIIVLFLNELYLPIISSNIEKKLSLAITLYFISLGYIKLLTIIQVKRT